MIQYCFSFRKGRVVGNGGAGSDYREVVADNVRYYQRYDRGRCEEIAELSALGTGEVLPDRIYLSESAPSACHFLNSRLPCQGSFTYAVSGYVENGCFKPGTAGSSK